MAKYVQMTQVFVNGVDVSNLVDAVDIHRRPGHVQTASVEFSSPSLAVDAEGKLIVSINTEE